MKSEFEATNKRKTISKNVLLNVISRILYLAIGFVSRKLIIVFVAVEYLGLSSLYSNILDLLNLAELGIGVALQVCLFKPIINNDRDKIGNILSIARKIYLTIACAVIAVGGIISIFLPYIVKDNPFDNWYIRIAFLISVGGVAFSYLCADKRLFFEANESLYIATVCDVVTKILTVSAGLVFLALLKENGYLIYLGLTSFQLFLSNVVLLLLYNHRYEHHYTVDKEFQKSQLKTTTKNLKDVVPNKIGVFIFTSTDSIVITIFIGLAMAGIYSNYMVLFLAFLSMSAIVSNALVSTFGKMVKQGKTPQEILAKFKIYEILQFAFSSFTAICLYCLIDKFVIIWLGEDFLLGTIPVILLSVDYLIHSLFQPMSTLFTSTEKFRQDKICSLISAGLNIGISLILVNFIGIHGVILGTLIANIFTYIMRAKLIYGSYFKKSTLKRLLIGLIQIVLIVALGFGIKMLLTVITFENKWVDFFVSTEICLVLSNLLNILLFVVYIATPKGRNRIKEFLKKRFPKTIKKIKARNAIKANKKRVWPLNQEMVSVFICQTEHIFDKSKPLIEEMLRRNHKVILYIVEDNNSHYDEKTIFEKEFPNICVKLIDTSLKELKPDYVFYPRPYDPNLPEELRSSEVVKYAKTIYIPYGYSLMNIGGINLGDGFTNNMNFIFADNSYSSDYVESHRIKTLAKYNQLLNIGYPYFEDIIKNKTSYLSLDNAFKDIKNNGFKAIWTPRWNNDVSVGGSNFLRYWLLFKEYFVGNNDYNFVFRPHPYTFKFCLENNLITEEEMNIYLSSISNSKNSIYDNKESYLGTFANSDVLITDVSSIVPEYLLLNKPIIFCHNEESDNLNSFANEMCDVFYNAYSFEDVKKFAEQLRNGKDPLKEKRTAYVKLFEERFNGCTKKIVDIIEMDFANK